MALAVLVVLAVLEVVEAEEPVLERAVAAEVAAEAADDRPQPIFISLQVKVETEELGVTEEPEALVAPEVRAERVELVV